MIRATQDGDATIRVVVPGQLETTFTTQKGFVATWYDLKHDPEKKRDLAPVAAENGILWTKAAPAGTQGDSWYANPPEKMDLLESGPTRIRVRLSGWHHKYGKTRPQDLWKELGFRQTFTMYPTGDAYLDYALVAEKPLPLHHFLLIIKSTGAWGDQGKGEGKGEAHCAGEHGPKRPSQPNSSSSFVLQWSDGPTHFQDILMVMYRGSYAGWYWAEGYQDQDYRAGLSIVGRWPDSTIPAGEDHIRLLMRFGCDMNSPQAASLYAKDYRSPDKLAATEGQLDVSDEGDRDGDGFNEAEGCYVIKNGGERVEFTLHGAKTARMSPAFKVKQWRGAVPGSISCGSKTLAAGPGFNASVSGGVLLLQVLQAVREDAKIIIAPAQGR